MIKFTSIFRHSVTGETKEFVAYGWDIRDAREAAEAKLRKWAKSQGYEWAA